ncbi:MAG TPA: hypothetical protein DG753_10275 [Clostridium sp.]|nr:hypothetical protein [Clostridium sp.]
MYKISSKVGRYKEASEYSAKLLDVKNEESLLINRNYSAYSIEKYKNELEIRRLNDEKIDNYIRWFAVILVLSIIIIIAIMKNRMLSQKSKCDGLTNINNRLYFNEIYEKKLKKNQRFYLYIFDIDNFKKVNDAYGHLIGDEVLKKIAEVGREIVGTKGKIFRYGGEEFVIIVDHLNENIIINMAEDIRKKIEQLTWDNGMKITISMGIADSAIEKENVLEIADSRLYISKTTGKNKITFAS